MLFSWTDMKKREVIEFIIVLVLVLFFSYSILVQFDRRDYHFFWTPIYHYIVYALLIIGLLFVVFRRFESINRITKQVVNRITKYLKYPYYLILLPAVFVPVLRCHFKVPYIFCRICPKQCPWGQTVRFALPAFLLMNIDSRFWCYKLCPLGTIQDQQCRICSKRICLPKWVSFFRYTFLAFAIAIPVLVWFAVINFKKTIFFLNIYQFVIGTFIAAIIIFLLSFFIPRFWCNYFCPVGSFSDIVLKIKNCVKK